MALNMFRCLRVCAFVVVGVTLSHTGTAKRVSKSKANIVVGAFVDKDVRVNGHARILKENLVWYLARSGKYHVLADKRSIAEANEAIVKNNTAMTRDDQWVEIGHSLGASHILMGEIRVDSSACVAVARIVHLKSKKEIAQSMPELYNCEVDQLRNIAARMQEQLTGVKTDTESLPPIEIKLIRDEAEAKLGQLPKAPVSTKPSPRKTYTVFNLMDDANTHSELIIAFYLAVPVLFLLLGLFFRLFGASFLPRMLKSGIQTSLMLTVLHGLALGACTAFLDVEVMDKFDVSLILSPVLGLIGMLAVARIVSFRLSRRNSNF